MQIAPLRNSLFLSPNRSATMNPYTSSPANAFLSKGVTDVVPTSATAYYERLASTSKQTPAVLDIVAFDDRLSSGSEIHDPVGFEDQDVACERGFLRHHNATSSGSPETMDDATSNVSSSSATGTFASRANQLSSLQLFFFTLFSSCLQRVKNCTMLEESVPSQSSTPKNRNGPSSGHGTSFPTSSLLDRETGIRNRRDSDFTYPYHKHTQQYPPQRSSSRWSCLFEYVSFFLLNYLSCPLLFSMSDISVSFSLSFFLLAIRSSFGFPYPSVFDLGFR